MPMSIWWNRQFFCSLMYQLWNMTPNAVSFLTRSEPEICGSNWHQTWIVGNTQSCLALYWHGFGIKIHQIYIIQLSVLVFSNLDKQTFDNRQDVMMTIKQYQKYTYPHLPFICLAHLREKKYMYILTSSPSLQVLIWLRICPACRRSRCQPSSFQRPVRISSHSCRGKIRHRSLEKICENLGG